MMKVGEEEVGLKMRTVPFGTSRCMQIKQVRTLRRATFDIVMP